MANPKSHQKIHFLNKQLAKNKKTPLRSRARRRRTATYVWRGILRWRWTHPPLCLPPPLPPSLALPFVCCRLRLQQAASLRGPWPRSACSIQKKSIDGVGGGGGEGGRGGMNCCIERKAHSWMWLCVCLLLVRIFLVAAFRVLVGAPGNLGFVQSGKDLSEMCWLISRCWFLAIS